MTNVQRILNVLEPYHVYLGLLAKTPNSQDWGLRNMIKIAEYKTPERAVIYAEKLQAQWGAADPTASFKILPLDINASEFHHVRV